MSTPTTEQPAGVAGDTAGTEGTAPDPFDLDIVFIEGVPAAETVLMCATGDNCGTSCPSACTTS